MIYNCEAERPDQTPLLGRELTSRENQLYSVLYLLSLQGPVPMRKLYKEIYGDEIFPNRAAGATIGTLVRRVRAKLGEEAIITKPRLGYLAKRAVI